MTVLNDAYMPFGKLFIGSLFDNINLERVNKIYFYDTGLSDQNKKYLLQFPKVEIVETEINTSYGEMHDLDWQQNVYSKTSFLLQTIKKDNKPTIMIDSDSVFVYDFFDLIDADKDFIACKRDARPGFSNHIGSFFVINAVEKAEEFINQWVAEINSGNEKHKESPALSRVLKQNDSFSVGELSEDTVSYFSFSQRPVNSEVRIIHLKSDAGRETIEKRINQEYLAPYMKYLEDV